MGKQQPSQPSQPSVAVKFPHNQAQLAGKTLGLEPTQVSVAELDQITDAAAAAGVPLVVTGVPDREISGKPKQQTEQTEQHEQHEEG